MARDDAFNPSMLFLEFPLAVAPGGGSGVMLIHQFVCRGPWALPFQKFSPQIWRAFAIFAVLGSEGRVRSAPHDEPRLNDAMDRTSFRQD